MALDVYVGALTRYYTGDWENVAERAGRTRGAGTPVGRQRDAASVRPAVLAWREALAASLGDQVVLLPDWNESADAPHFTGRPGWDGFGSLVLWAAYAEHPALRRPDSLPEEWDDDPALVRSNTQGSRYSHLVRNVELWLPSPFDFTFEGEDVDGRRTVIGSVLILARQLGELNSATWKASAGEVVRWAGQPPPDDAMLEIKARYAFAILHDLARRAVELRLPMKLDY
jgi:hypothetical protein